MNSNNRNQHNQTLLMLELLRSSILKKEPTSIRFQVDWDSLMDQSAEEGILAWVWDGICDVMDKNWAEIVVTHIIISTIQRSKIMNKKFAFIATAR